MIITLSGTPGSGKSSVGRALAKKLGYQFYSAGDVRGKYAVSHGMTLHELNKLAEKDPASDKLVDEYMKELSEREDNFIVDARLGFFFVPKSVKIFLDADPAIRYERIFKEEREDEKFKDLKEAKRITEKRVASDIKRYERLYQVNPYDLYHYDLVVDTTKVSIDDAAGQIYRFAMFNSNPSKRK
jgi:cytidylate kinase